MSNTGTIAKNTAWFGLENAVNFTITFFTSIAIARTLGPSKMGYIIYVTWLANVVSSLGGLGIPATTRKYMAEFLGRGDRGTARFIYLRTLWLQAGLAALATAGIVGWVVYDAQSDYRLAASLIAMSIFPAMVNFISAQANVAREELFANLPASAVSSIVYFLGIGSTVIFKWGVLGVGASMLAMRTADCFVRLVPTFRHILTWDEIHIFPEGLRARMLTFAWKSVATMLVALIVWERSEFFLLKNFCSDIRQVAFYSLAFSMAGNLLLPSTIFSSAIAATIYAQYGRDKSRLPDIAASAIRYLALTAIPMHVIFTALAVPALLLLYGRQYEGAMLVVTVAPLLCIPKAFIGPAQDLLQSAERQSYVVIVTALAGVIDLGVAWWLVQSHGAVGACIGSGVAQFTALAILWFVAIRLFKVKLPWFMIGKIVIISALAALAAHLVARHLPPFWGLLGGAAVALASMLILLYAARVLEEEDRQRFSGLIQRFPKAFAHPADALLTRFIRTDYPSADAVHLDS